MKLEKLEAYGFKAFADKATLNFQEGITAIVGPNGCGKSNVVDAIRWVFAERSPKLLRSKVMQDVIFYGTERRKAMSYSEVSLTFNNAGPDRIFKNLEFDQVVLTRKIYKDGHSEFFINGTQARMTDIAAIIRETGLGREGYSIVGQSRITEIINAKPEARRAIFEDAAGVLPAKQARKEALANLAEYKINKEQLELLLDEIGRNLNTLERKAEAAKKYIEIRNELMLLEANSYIFQKDNHAAQVQRIQAVIDGLVEEIDHLNKELEANEDKFNSLMQEQASLDSQLTEAQKEQTALAVKRESILGQGNTFSATKDGYLRTREDYSNRLKQLEEDQDKANASYREFYSKLKMAEEEKEDTENDYNEAVKRQNELTKEILDRELALENKNSEINKLLESVGDIKANIGKIEAQKQATLDRIAEYDEDIENIQKDIDANEGAKQALEESSNELKAQKDKLEATIERLNNRYSELEERINFARERTAELNSECESLRTKIPFLEQMINSRGGAVNKLLAAAKQNDSLKSKIVGVVASLMDVSEKLQVAIETALGNDINSVVVNYDYDTTSLIDYLKKNNLGSVKFLPLNSYKTRAIDPACRNIVNERGCLGIASDLIKFNPKYERIFLGLLGGTVICENAAIGVDLARKYNYQVRIITLDGEKYETSGAIIGGSNRSGEGLLSLESQLKSAKEEFANKANEFNEIKIQYKEDVEEYGDLDGQIQEYEKEAEEANIKYVAENSRYEAMVNIIVGLQDRLTKATKDKASAQEQYELYAAALAKVSQESSSVTSSKEDVDLAARAGREEFNAMKEEKSQIDATVTTLSIQLQDLKNNIERYNGELTRLDGVKENIKANINQCRELLSTNDTNIKDVDSKIKKTVMSDEEKKRLDSIESVIDDINRKKIELSDKIKKASDEKGEISQNILSATAKKGKNEASLVALDERIKNLEEKIKEDYDLDYESAQQFKDENFDYASAQERIKHLKGAKNQLGTVDVNSIEEYQEVKVRFEEKNHEYEDLIKAEADLNKIIDDLSKEILDKFNAEFIKIQQNFQSTFTELFAGGTGRLTIMEPEEGQDPLDAGVEIYAQPPGKKIKNMISLSGGEQALTALAILFAILRLRPLPFCVLDEVEAALDEGNVGVYAKYLKKFAKDTQFIVITHRKPTMEKADVLFGITQQERGVSKVVQVSLEEAVKHSKTEAEREVK